jgi:hypothetical protein
MLCLSADDGSVSIYSLKQEEMGKVIASWNIEYLRSPITKIYYHRDVGLIISSFKGRLYVYDSMEFK